MAVHVHFIKRLNDCDCIVGGREGGLRGLWIFFRWSLSLLCIFLQFDAVDIGFSDLMCPARPPVFGEAWDRLAENNASETMKLNQMKTIKGL